MVVESLLFPLKAEKRPWQMFFLGFLYASIGIALSLWIFREQSSLIMVFMITMASLPIFYNAIKLEESKDMLIDNESAILKEHNKALIFLMLLFLGIMISSVFWYVALPAKTSSVLFERQTQTISDINTQISGDVIQQLNTFTKILFNNTRVLAFSILFAFIYCVGAIFILTWNATVIGTAIGNFIRSSLSDYSHLVGFDKLGMYFQIVSIGLLRYALHGIPEILAYFYGGLAGGIISVAIVNHHYSSAKFSHILHDAADLLLISVAFLVLAAFLEVFITPLLF